MCKLCVKSVEDYFPDCPEKQYGDFLMSATSYPFGSALHVRSQLKEAKDAGCLTYKDAITYAHKQLDDEMKKFKEEDKKRNKSIVEP